MEQHGHLEKEHIIASFSFELNQLTIKAIQERTINDLLVNVSTDLAEAVAKNVGVKLTAKPKVKPHNKKSNALSMDKLAPNIKGRKVAILAGDGVNGDEVSELKAFLKSNGALCEVIAKYNGNIKAADGSAIAVDRVAVNAPSVIYDAVFVPSGSASAVGEMGIAVHFLAEAYMHGKAIAAVGDDGEAVLKKAKIPVGDDAANVGVTVDKKLKPLIKSFSDAMLKRHYDRNVEAIPA